jgi:hypothetical protein
VRSAPICTQSQSSGANLALVLSVNAVFRDRAHELTVSLGRELQKWEASGRRALAAPKAQSDCLRDRADEQIVRLDKASDQRLL